MVESLSGGEGHMRFLLLFLLSITNGVTFAEAYPTRPVRMIEPFGAGGS
jgi:tripartite-type tricarboxylate transporter receptor subunit TctC